MLNSSAAARAQGIHWTRPYLVALCDEIRQALEAWAGEPDASAPDLDQARAASRRLAASLETLGVSGAAGLADALGEALDAIEAPDQETATVLLESVAVLPDYLERLETGAPDLPEVLREFIGRTRAAAGLEAIEAPPTATGLDALDDDDSGDFAPLDAETLRRGYQRALRDWLKDSEDVAGAGRIHRCDPARAAFASSASWQALRGGFQGAGRRPAQAGPSDPGASRLAGSAAAPTERRR